jgi:hypothetical protein
LLCFDYCLYTVLSILIVTRRGCLALKLKGMPLIMQCSGFIGENGVVGSGPRKKLDPFTPRAPCLFVCLFVHPFSHICNNGHGNYRLQFIYYNTTYNIWTSTQYNIINNNTKFKDQLEVVSITTDRNMCIYTLLYLLTHSMEQSPS